MQIQRQLPVALPETAAALFFLHSLHPVIIKKEKEEEARILFCFLLLPTDIQIIQYGSL